MPTTDLQPINAPYTEILAMSPQGLKTVSTNVAVWLVDGLVEHSIKVEEERALKIHELRLLALEMYRNRQTENMIYTALLTAIGNDPIWNIILENGTMVPLHNDIAKGLSCRARIYNYQDTITSLNNAIRKKN